MSKSLCPDMLPLSHSMLVVGRNDVNQQVVSVEKKRAGHKLKMPSHVGPSFAIHQTGLTMKVRELLSFHSYSILWSLYFTDSHPLENRT